MSSDAIILAGPMDDLPPRFWWLKRLTAAWLLLLVATIGLRYLWGWDVQRRRDAFVSEVRARHEPILPGDFPAVTVTSDDNAAFELILAAYSAVRTPSYEEWSAHFREQLPLSADDVREISKWISANRDAITRVHANRERTRINWTWMHGYRPYKHAVNELMLSLCSVALLEHQNNDDQAAVNTILDLSSACDVIAWAPPRDAQYLTVGVRLELLAVVRQISSELRVGPDAGCSPRDDVKGLIRILADQTEVEQARRSIWFQERASALDAASEEFEFAATEPIRWLKAPSLRLDQLRLSRWVDTQATADLGPDPLGSRPVPPNPPAHPTLIWSITHPLSEYLYPSTSYRSQNHLLLQTESRITAIELALRLYAVDHQGTLPKQLGELVPMYLAVIPTDPFSKDQSPIRYRPDPVRPVLYSVGFNRSDDGGSEFSAKSSPAPWAMMDAVFPIFREKAPSSEHFLGGPPID